MEETDTIWLLDIPGTCVSEESEMAKSVNEANLRYVEVGLEVTWNNRHVKSTT